MSQPADTPAAGAGTTRRRFRKASKVIAILLLAGVAWTAWAAAALYDFAAGLRNADPVALERRIDWSSVRERLREDLQARPGPQAGGSSIDMLVSQQGIANLLRTAKLDEHGWDTAPPDGAQRQASGRSRIQYAFFTGGPFAFRIDVEPDSDKIKEPLVLLFRWAGDWRLTRVFLPADAVANPSQASQAPARAVVAAAPEPQPLPSGAQRAVLYEEDPSDPEGKRYAGSAIWRTEDMPPVAGGASEFAVTAHVSVPERSLSMTIAIRRNLDRTLPASHTIELKIDLPPDSPTGGIQDVPGIRMKPNEQAVGQQLSGSRVKVSNDFYLIGLSAIDVDVRHNMDLLTGQPWFGVPFVYNNRSRAVLVIEKGPAGEKSIADALARWAKPAVAEGASRKQ
jgi:hypothetical protein